MILKIIGFAINILSMYLCTIKHLLILITKTQRQKSANKEEQDVISLKVIVNIIMETLEL